MKDNISINHITMNRCLLYDKIKKMLAEHLAEKIQNYKISPLNMAITPSSGLSKRKKDTFCFRDENHKEADTDVLFCRSFSKEKSRR